MITLAMEVVCDLVRLSIGPGYVALSTLGGEGSTVCVTLNLVCCSMGSYFSWVDGTLDTDRSALGVSMKTLGSEAGGWTGA